MFYSEKGHICKLVKHKNKWKWNIIEHNLQFWINVCSLKLREYAKIRGDLYNTVQEQESQRNHNH